jgi:phosphoribosylformylglycinamidine synthase
MSFGNHLGVKLEDSLSIGDLFLPAYGDILVEVSEDTLKLLSEDFAGDEYSIIGHVIEEEAFLYGKTRIAINEALETWMKTLEKVYPSKTDFEDQTIETKLYDGKKIYIAKEKFAKPRVFIPVLPGTNCEYDSQKAFEDAGAIVNTVVFKNMSGDDISESVRAFEKAVKEAQILMFPGGFSAGDEPDGSAKFFATVFRNEKIKETVNKLIKERDGLILGICNGFQALIKLGLLPYGEITPQKEDSPTLTMNRIGKHVSKYVYTKVVSNKSPWLMKAELDAIYSIPTSHGEGRFVANDAWIKKLIENGQVATQYVDLEGNPTLNSEFNPNGSYYAIEGITSPDGRVLGKMAHSERKGDSVAINIVGNKNQLIFESGVSYYR